MPLVDYVKLLENCDNRTRGQHVLNTLKTAGIEPAIQECRWPRIRNIIVDFSPDPKAKRLLFSAHYDARKGSPAANGNASGVAVLLLLGLCRELKGRTAPVRVVFFDREEAWFRTPLLRLGLLGSLYYVWKSDLSNVAAVYNLEFCGLGESLGVWPVKEKEANLPAVNAVAKAAAKLSIPLSLAHIPWPFITSGHLSFRFKGTRNAVTLSLLPASQIPGLGKALSGLSLPKLLTGRRPALPEPLSMIHSPKDTSDGLAKNH